MDDSMSGDICRVCRCEGSVDRPLFHPCICTGSIKFIHQECLVQWLRYSKKEFCELCNYRFSFTPIYSPDMPKRIPIRLVFSGVLGTVMKAVKFWLHYTLVAVAWLGVVPLTACRIYRTLFTGSVTSIFSLPITVFSTENIAADILLGSAVVSLTLLTFIGLVWLREQILHGGGPVWLEPPGEVAPANAPGDVVPVAADVNLGDAANPAGEEAPVEPPAPEILEGVGEGDEQQWNPMEWDRAADDLTWERLLGLDGSLVFLEHVFWVISLNSLFILVFAFCPYHIGQFTMTGLKMKHVTKGVNFEGLLITMIGYCMIGLNLIIFHTITNLLGFKKVSRALGLCYVVVKVALLLVGEILVFPVVCGWWLDICSLSLFDATLKDRFASFQSTPWASVFLHWLVGMVYVFYFASFVILLREVFRPGVLWFLRNLNDPDFNPIQEMIHLPLLRHIRRFCASLILFGTSIFVMLYCPSRIIKSTLPSFLPYTTQSNEGNVDEISMELLLLLVFLPAIQDQNHTREWLKWLVQQWCRLAAWALDLRSYLFGDVLIDNLEDDATGENEDYPADGGDDDVIENEPRAPEPPVLDADDQQGGLGAVHQALLIRDGPVGYQPYIKPRYFAARIVGLLALMVISWLIISLFTIVVPVWIGRQIFSCWVEEGHKIYELYTSATGFYVCLLMARGIAMFAGWLRQGWTALGTRMKEWAIIAGKAIIAFFLLLILIPFMYGVLFDLVVLTPIRVPLYQTPIYLLWQDWFLGLMYTKITVALTFLGPDWWLKLSIEQLYQDGLRNMNLGSVFKNLVVPCVTGLGIALSVPYILSHGLIPLILVDLQLVVNIQRRIYPFLLLTVMFVSLLVLQFKQFTKLLEHIKNDRYLVGRRLVNYHHHAKPGSI